MIENIVTGKFKPYFGTYYFMGLVFEVKQMADMLVTSVAGIPAGYEILLQPMGEDQFKMQGGPIDGETVTFQRNSLGEIVRMSTDLFDLSKIDPHTLAELPKVQRLNAPPFDLTPNKEADFAALFETAIDKGDGGWVDYRLPYPVHEFIQYITSLDTIIFHGSNNTKIDTFEPVRKSIELRDETGRGNIQGVYGTHEGLWAMFFSVVDRGRLKGSIRNGVLYFHNRLGEQLASYNFSINQEQLAERPYTEGALYLLPRDSFQRMKMTPASYSNEWVSEQPVKPYARLCLQPHDFPFLDQISGHDDSTLIRLGALSAEIRADAVAADLKEDQFEVTLPEGAPVITRLDEYISIQREMMPAARYAVTQVAGGVVLVVSNLPPALKQMLSDEYKDLLA